MAIHDVIKGPRQRRFSGGSSLPHLVGIIAHNIILAMIIIATTILGIQHVINGDAVVGLFGAVAATTAGTAAYRSGSATRATDHPETQ